MFTLRSASCHSERRHMLSELWFRDVFGFAEKKGFNTNRGRFLLHEKPEGGHTLESHANGAVFDLGVFEYPSLSELRARLAPKPEGEPLGALTFGNIVGDVGELHRDHEQAGAVFQVASQFNCLEMAGPGIRPEDGITKYVLDKTQGPSCALACPAATVFRNYFVRGTGQAGENQLDMLCDVAKVVDNEANEYWKLKNGYCMPRSAWAMEELGERLQADEELCEAVREHLRVGIHWSTEVTPGSHKVCQVFCSALPVAYVPVVPAAHWRSFGRAVLDATYDATLCAAALLAHQRQARVAVYLTVVGGGAFGNPLPWITGALERALRLHEQDPLDVRVVHFGKLAGGVFAALEEHYTLLAKARRPAAAAAPERSKPPKKRPAADATGGDAKAARVKKKPAAFAR